MPGAVPYTSTVALCNATFKYIKELANNSLEAFKNNESLLKGLNVYKNKVTHPAVAKSFDLEYTDPLKLL